MARQHREITPDDIPTGNRPPIDMTNGMDDREPERILLVDNRPDNQSRRSPGKGIPSDQELAELAFMEEEVEIMLEKPAADEKPVLAYPFSVNGRTEWVPTDRPWPVKRKFLEVILTSQPFRVATREVKPGADDDRNMMYRYQSKRFNVSIINDPNPRGHAWRQRVSLQA